MTCNLYVSGMYCSNEAVLTERKIFEILLKQ